MMQKTGKKTIQFILLTLTLALPVACDSEPGNPLPEGPQVFPSALWYTETGGTVRLHPAAPIAANFLGKDTVWKEELPQLDGFSPIQPILFASMAACRGLPLPGQEGWSIADTSPVLLWDGTAGTRIPWFGEPSENPNWCELYPLKAFADNARVTVGITASFRGTLVGDPSAVKEQPHIPGFSGTLKFSWSFPVGTLRNRVHQAYSLVRASLTTADTARIVELHTEPSREELGRQDPLLYWRGFFRVPRWSDDQGRIHFIDDKPVLQGYENEEFFLIVPRSVTTETTIPLIQYGHGLFGDPREILYGSQGALRTETAGVYAAVAWGMAVRYFHRAIVALADPEQLPLLQDIVWQSLVNQVLFTRVFRDQLGPLLTKTLGQPVSNVVDYVGISQGGILGSPLAALSPDLRRMVLHVGGGGWTAMMTHSSNWAKEGGFGYGDAVNATVPDATQRSLLYALWQPLWDRWDPAIFAPFWLLPPAGIGALPPPVDRKILYAYSMMDPQVPNFSSETVLRTAEVPLLLPSFTQPTGIATLTYDDPIPAVVANQWNAGSVENAHGEPRSFPAFVKQVRHFIRDGIVVDTCGGKACRFDP